MSVMLCIITFIVAYNCWLEIHEYKTLFNGNKNLIIILLQVCVVNSTVSRQTIWHTVMVPLHHISQTHLMKHMISHLAGGTRLPLSFNNTQNVNNVNNIYVLPKMT